MGLLYGPLGLGPGTTCWPGGGPKCSAGGRVKKWPPGGVDLRFTPPHAHLCQLTDYISGFEIVNWNPSADTLQTDVSLLQDMHTDLI